LIDFPDNQNVVYRFPISLNFWHDITMVVILCEFSEEEFLYLIRTQVLKYIPDRNRGLRWLCISLLNNLKLKTMKSIKIITVLIFTLLVTDIIAQTKINISLSDTRFPYPIVAKWINEYKKINPNANISLFLNKQNADSLNLKIIASAPLSENISSGDQYIIVNRYALLPVINSSNPDFQNVYRKGFSENDFKKNFFIDSAFIFEPNTNKQISYNVYVPVEQAGASRTFAEFFGFKPSEIKGKKINGDEKYLVSAIQKDYKGLTFNYPGYLYDLKNRLPLPGIEILPVDINNNGTLDKDEKAIANLDELIKFLEDKNGINNIPVGNIGFIVNSKNVNPDLKGFIEWVTTEGQKYNHEYGFLNRVDNIGNVKGYQASTSR
jgi:ABC-type phosphate transport system substrate-binding protein